MDFTERLETLKEAGMLDDTGISDVQKVLEIFRRDYGVVLEEENASMFIAHLCAAYNRNQTHEEVPPLEEENRKEIRALPTYSRSEEILHKMMDATENPLSKAEQEYILMHINNLIGNLMETGEWKADPPRSR